MLWRLMEKQRIIQPEVAERWGWRVLVKKFPTTNGCDGMVMVNVLPYMTWLIAFPSVWEAQKYAMRVGLNLDLYFTVRFRRSFFDGFSNPKVLRGARLTRCWHS